MIFQRALLFEVSFSERGGRTWVMRSRARGSSHARTCMGSLELPPHGDRPVPTLGWVALPLSPCLATPRAAPAAPWGSHSSPPRLHRHRSPRTDSGHCSWLCAELSCLWGRRAKATSLLPIAHTKGTEILVQLPQKAPKSRVPSTKTSSSSFQKKERNYLCTGPGQLS